MHVRRGPLHERAESRQMIVGQSNAPNTAQQCVGVLLDRRIELGEDTATAQIDNDLGQFRIGQQRRQVQHFGHLFHHDQIATPFLQHLQQFRFHIDLSGMVVGDVQLDGDVDLIAVAHEQFQARLEEFLQRTGTVAQQEEIADFRGLHRKGMGI